MLKIYNEITQFKGIAFFKANKIIHKKSYNYSFNENF